MHSGCRLWGGVALVANSCSKDCSCRNLAEDPCYLHPGTCCEGCLSVGQVFTLMRLDQPLFPWAGDSSASRSIQKLGDERPGFREDAYRARVFASSATGGDAQGRTGQARAGQDARAGQHDASDVQDVNTVSAREGIFLNSHTPLRFAHPPIHCIPLFFLMSQNYHISSAFRGPLNDDDVWVLSRKPRKFRLRPMPARSSSPPVLRPPSLASISRDRCGPHVCELRSCIRLRPGKSGVLRCGCFFVFVFLGHEPFSGQ